jgi:hypothetical protein
LQLTEIQDDIESESELLRLSNWSSRCSPPLTCDDSDRRPLKEETDEVKQKDGDASEEADGLIMKDTDASEETDGLIMKDRDTSAHLLESSKLSTRGSSGIMSVS